MKRHVLKLAILIGAVTLFCSCEKIISWLMPPGMTPFDAYINFVNDAGENLVEKYQLIDSTNDPLRLKADEFALTMKINNGTPGSVNVIFYEYEKMAFLKYLDLTNRSYKKDYLFDYDFICPKLFGDPNPRNIKIFWKSHSKRGHFIQEVRFDDRLVYTGTPDHHGMWAVDITLPGR